MRELITIIIPVAVLIVIILITKFLKKELEEIRGIRKLNANYNIENIEFTVKEKFWLIKICLLCLVGSIIFTTTMLNALRVIF